MSRKPNLVWGRLVGSGYEPGLGDHLVVRVGSDTLLVHGIDIKSEYTDVLDDGRRLKTLCIEYVVEES